MSSLSLSKIILFSASIFLIVIAYALKFPAEEHIILKSMEAGGESIMNLDDNFRKLSQTAIVLGYTGATGSALVRELADRNVYTHIKLAGRRNVEYDDDKLKAMEQVVVDFDKLEENHGAVFNGVDHVFSCLGTTRGQSGADGFRKVDHDYIMATARLAKSSNCSQYHHQSSAGADKDSMMLYTQVKGQVEAEISDLGFNRVVHYRPAILMNPNRENTRVGETVIRCVMKGVSKLTNSGSITVQKVARTMINVAVTPCDRKVDVLENGDLHKIADLK